MEIVEFDPQWLAELERDSKDRCWRLLQKLLSGGINHTVSVEIVRHYENGKLDKWVNVRGYEWDKPETLKHYSFMVTEGGSWVDAIDTALSEIGLDADP